ncbi:MAG: AAA family ATPase [Bacteroidia bacterium]|nr:AAA family ATPase [Bacteroidia bacterium]
MQRIQIRNFGPLREIDLEIKDFMVLIGPNAGGKSTIAKLVYFFRSLHDLVRDQLFFEAWEHAKQLNIFSSATGIAEEPREVYENVHQKELAHVEKWVLDAFKHLFTGYSGFRIQWSTGHGFIVLESKEHHPAGVEFSGEIQEGWRHLNQQYRSFMQEARQSRIYASNGQQQFRYRMRILLHEKAYQMFHGPAAALDAPEESLYCVAQRSVLSAVPDDIVQSKESVVHSWTENFIFRYRHALQNLPKQPVAWAASDPEDPELRSATSLLTCLSEISGSEVYTIREGRVMLRPLDETRRDVTYPLEQASSGEHQAAVLALLLLHQFSEDSGIGPRSRLLYVEEPEMHLYPAAQKSMTEMLGLWFNYHAGNKLFITTHSPYILTALDNLVQAHETAAASEYNDEAVAEIVPRASWIAWDRVGAYHLDRGGRTQDLKDAERRSIGGQQMDEDADAIQQVYEKLLDIKYPAEA